jgi:catechol 2,3-dioxygenase-like lactoylglutathione lyase family enzyme
MEHVGSHQSINFDEVATVSRVQLALNVTDLDAAVEFYSTLFATEPAKHRPGYANFAIADPPLKLILFQGDGRGGTINHLGVEVDSTEAVAAAQRRLAGEGLATATEDQVTCCFARQDKVWVDDPDGAPWEVYTVLEDVEQAVPCSCAPDGVEGEDAEVSAAPLRTVEPGAPPRCC